MRMCQVDYAPTYGHYEFSVKLDENFSRHDQALVWWTMPEEIQVHHHFRAAITKRSARQERLLTLFSLHDYQILFHLKVERAMERATKITSLPDEWWWVVRFPTYRERDAGSQRFWRRVWNRQGVFDKDLQDVACSSTFRLTHHNLSPHSWLTGGLVVPPCKRDQGI